MILAGDALASLAGGALRHPTPQHAAARRRLLTNGLLLLAGQLLGWLPFAWVKRVAFLYHYIPSFLLSMQIFGITFDALTQRAAAVRLCRCLSLRLLLSVALQLAAAASTWRADPARPSSPTALSSPFVARGAGTSCLCCSAGRSTGRR